YPNEPPMDAGIYLIKKGAPIWEPGAMLLVKNDPNYNEQWPRPLVPYERIYGVKEPQRLPSLRNDGTLSKYLPEGTPFGLIGTTSTAWSSTWPRPGTSCGPAKSATTAAAATPTARSRPNSRTPSRPGPTTFPSTSPSARRF